MFYSLADGADGGGRYYDVHKIENMRHALTISACFNVNAICSSLGLVFFIVSSFLVGRHKAGKLSLNPDEKTGRISLSDEKKRRIYELLADFVPFFSEEDDDAVTSELT